MVSTEIVTTLFPATHSRAQDHLSSDCRKLRGNVAERQPEGSKLLALIASGPGMAPAVMSFDRF